MIKMAGFFKSKRWIAIAIGLTIIVFTTVFFTNGKAESTNEKSNLISKNYSYSFSNFIGIRSNEIKEIRLEFYNGNASKPLKISDKGIITSLLDKLNNIKLLSLTREDITMSPSNGFYIVLKIGSRDLYFYIDYTTGGIAKYAPYMSSLPKFTHRFEDIKQLKKVIDEFTANAASMKPETIDQAVSRAIIGKTSSYGSGEAATEGHVILGTEEKNGKVTVYTISSFGAFGFKNGIFTKVSGSGAIPTVMIFSKNQRGQYALLEYKEPEDGARYLKSTKAMFPKRLWSKVLSVDKYYPDLIKQQEVRASEYLKSIGRTAKVSAKYVEKKLPKINVQASNKLLTAFKGLELYVWKDKNITGDDNVRYNLLPGTNRNKQESEILNVKSSAKNFKTIEDTLIKYAEGEFLMVKIYNKIDKTELKELYDFLHKTKLRLIVDES